MPAPPLANNFNGGTDGATITTGNSGGASGDAFQSISATPVFTNVQWHSGGMAMRIVDAAGTTHCAHSGLGSITTNVYFRTYMYMDAFPGTNAVAILMQTGAAANCAWININTTGKVNARNAANTSINTSTASVNLSSWFRLEWRVKASVTVGEIEWRLYNSPDSETITETINAAATQVLGANIDLVRWGETANVPGTPFTVYFDDVAVSTTDWIGPSRSALVVPVNKPSVVYLRKNT